VGLPASTEYSHKFLIVYFLSCFMIRKILKFCHVCICTDVQKLTTKILKVIPFTKNKRKMSDDKMLFDAPVSSKTFTFKSVLLQTEALNGILSSDIFVLFLVKGTAFKIFVVSFQTPCIHTHTHTHTICLSQKMK
jgi:hypothetical protein